MTRNPSTRHVAVVGGTGGIGRAIALRFAQEGDTVHVLGRNLAKAQEAASVIAHATGARVLAAECHLDDPASVEHAIKALPKFEVLVNAAGSIPRMSLLDTTPAHWRGAWSDKVLGAVETTRLACERMRVDGGGVVINIIGTAGMRPNPKTIMTSTANAMLIAFTQALGAQAVDWNVRVVGINPGLTATPRTEGLAAGSGGDAYKAMLRDMPFGRMGKAAEIADCAWFLASTQASYISGTVIDVDAGARCRV